MSAGHHHAHGHHGHHHHDHSSGNKRVLAVSLTVTALFMLVEAITGWLTNSLALLSDAGHMFSDATAMAVALIAFKLGERRADKRKSFGYQRFEILAAALNGLTLLLIAAWIIVEALQRLASPPEIAGKSMMMVAALGLAVNLFIAWYMMRSADTKENINMRGAYLHVLGDLLGSVGAIVAGLLILTLGWHWADPAISILIALLIAKSGWGVTRDSLNILMESAPSGIDTDKVAADITSIAGVKGVHDLHIWTITSRKHALSCHIVIGSHLTVSEAHEIILSVQAAAAAHGIGHATVQTEPPQHGHAEDMCVGV